MAKENMTYSHFDHRHNFAVWCAARAVQRKFTKTLCLQAALESCGVVELMKMKENELISQDDFDKHHERWCDSIIKSWERERIKGGSYGRAAKLLAIYLKSMIVVQEIHSKLAEVAHPPIDSRILKHISEDKSIQHPNSSNWIKIKWTTLNKSGYKNLINDFRDVFAGQPFWLIEKYWTVTDD